VLSQGRSYSPVSDILEVPGDIIDHLLCEILELISFHLELVLLKQQESISTNRGQALTESIQQ
jgi:hypothetical protein